MPELPEVETIARTLQQGGKDGPPLPGRIVQNAFILWERTLAAPSSLEFQERISGQRVSAVSRRGKFILVQFQKDCLLIHLRMSGSLRVESQLAENRQDRALSRHDRLVINFSDGWRLVFNDPRKFGRAWLAADQQEILGKLGLEPLDPGLSVEDFYTSLHKRHRQLKPLLLDQSFLAGIGNIYADEALYLAGLHPCLASDILSFSQAEGLLISIRQVLQDGIRRNGASIDWVYRGGSFQNMFRVYRRTGKPCLVCGSLIERVSVGQRSTHFCPVCQPSNPEFHGGLSFIKASESRNMR